MKRFGVLFAVAASAMLVLSGCAYTVQGHARQSPPQIATVRNTDGVNPCTLITADDVKSFGSFARPPAPSAELANSCQYTLNNRTTDPLTLATAFIQQYEQIRARQPEGREEIVDGHSTWISCGIEKSKPQGSKDQNAEEYTSMVCTTTVAINSTQSLLVAATAAPEVSGDELYQLLAPWIKAALSRIPE